MEKYVNHTEPWICCFPAYFIFFIFKYYMGAYDYLNDAFRYFSGSVGALFLCT